MIDRQNVIVLDDEEGAAQTLVDIIKVCGSDASYCCDAVAFLGLVNSTSPSLVFIDLKMPEIDGVEVLKELSKNGYRGNVVIISGEGSPLLSSARRVAEKLQLRIIGTLKKPFDFELVNSLIQRSGKFDVSASLSEYKEIPVSKTRDLVADLKDALSDNSLSIYLQPKVSCITGTLQGFEVLSRWKHRDIGFIPPDAFIPLAEVHGLIDIMTIQVFEKALTWLSEFDQSVMLDESLNIVTTPSISINISAQSISQEILFNRIVELCQKYNIEPQRITLELTESIALDDSSSALEHLTRLRLKGFHLSIDDFGTGYSSLVQLVKVPFSEIKIDKQFVIDFTSNAQSKAICKCIVDMGHSLGLHITAEGVEDSQTLSQLKLVNCTTAQGYHIAKPMPLESVLNWLRNRNSQRENERLAALDELSILDTPPESRFDRVTRLASKLFNTPISLISLIDENRQWFKSEQGLNRQETERSIAFCDSAIKQDEVFVVENAKTDDRFKDNPLVTGYPNIGFYAGAPIVTNEGYKLGTLCIIDEKPRKISSHETKTLKKLSDLVGREVQQTSADVLDEKSGLLPKGSYNSQLKRLHSLCKDLKINLWVISIRLMNINSLERSVGVEKVNSLIRSMASTLTPLAEFTDLIGKQAYSEFALIYMAISEEELYSNCDNIVDILQPWRENNKLTEIDVELDIEVGLVKVPFSDDRKLDMIFNDYWKLYSALVG